MTEKVEVQVPISEDLQKSIARMLDERTAASRKDSDRSSLWLTCKIVLGILVLAYAGWVVYTMQGKSPMPANEHAAVIEISGVIGGNEGSQQARSVIGLLSRAFGNETTRAVVLHVNSNGGSPSIADRIGQRARQLADQHQKPLVVHIDGAGASAAYLLALYADEIFASRYSMTGSIGAVINTLNWKDLAENVGVSQTSYASSDFKSALSPWNEANPEHDAVIHSLVNQVADEFMTEVIERRGGRLKMDTDELRQALIYTAPVALEKGLIDGIATLDQVIHDEYGLRSHHMKVRRNLYEQLVVTSFTKLESWFASQTGVR